jgi:hypothetical protein
MSNEARKTLKSYGYVLYKIYTQDAHRLAVIKALREGGFPNLTILSAAGHGDGQLGSMESTLVLDVLMPYSLNCDGRMRAAVERIRAENGDDGQTQVIMLRIPCYYHYVWRPPEVKAPEKQEQARVQGTLSLPAEAGGSGQ